MNAIDYRKIQELEEVASRHGFRVETSPHNYNSLCLMPKKINEAEHALPIYHDEAVFGYDGTVEGLLAFLAGWAKAYEYFIMLGATTKNKIEKRENAVRVERMVRVLASDNTEPVFKP